MKKIARYRCIYDELVVPITWTNAPENQRAAKGNDYVVRCVATANPPPEFGMKQYCLMKQLYNDSFFFKDWLLNGDRIKTNNRFVMKHEGLLIKNVQESDEGTYTCRAAVTKTGEMMERYIRLEVQTKPEITSLQAEYEAIEGQNFTVQCVGSGKPAPEFRWINQDQKDMSLADRFSFVGHKGQMSIAGVEEYDRGVYTCIAENSAGSTEQMMNLEVVVKPKIYELKNITMSINDEATLICKAKGRAAPSITFRRWGTTEEFRVGHQENDNRIILELNIDEEMGEASGILVISKTLPSDDGLYECIARNKAPEAAFEVAHIAVGYPPNFDHMRDLPPVYSWEGRPANLSCMADSFPAASIEWRWNERPIKEMGDKYLRIVEEGPRSDLIVEPADRRYYSAYKCVAVNRLGRAEHFMELREAHLPTPIVQPEPIQITATTVTFELVPPATEFGMPIKAFIGQYKEKRSLDWYYAVNRTWTPGTPYVIEDLRPSTPYAFRFAARNDVGLGQWSAERLLKTLDRSVPEKPEILNVFTQNKDGENEIPIVTSTYSDRSELIWKQPEDNGEPIDFYSIKYCPVSKRKLSVSETSWTSQQVNSEWNEIEKLCIEWDFIDYVYSNQMLSDLISDSNYRVELRAHNSIGYSLPTEVYLKTAKGVSEGLQTYEVQVVSNNSASCFHTCRVLIVFLIQLAINYF
jgi:neural cell adhesion molecule